MAEPDTSFARVVDDGPGAAFNDSDIKRGLAAGEFLAYYQPKADLNSGVVLGAEALIRWAHPQQGLLLPASFLPVVRRSGLSTAITELMLSLAACQCAGWRAASLDYTVSVNLPVALLGSHDLPQRFEELTLAQGLSPEHVMLEVTEDGWLSNQQNGREVLTRLRLRGFGLSIDDFGTGFSTLQQLLHAPFNEMKIDKSFILSAPHDAEAGVAAPLFSARMRKTICTARSLLAPMLPGVPSDAH